MDVNPSDQLCTYEEVYGLLRELEELVLYMKQDDYSWAGDDSGERAKNNLYALALLTSLSWPLEKGYEKQIEESILEAENRYISDKQYLLPFVLGLYIYYKQFENKRNEVAGKLLGILQKANKEEKRLPFAVEYLFSVSLFLDLLESDSSEEPAKELLVKAKSLASEVSKQFSSVNENETKAKILYLLAALSMKQELLVVYENFRDDVEKLRDRIREEDVLAFLLKPYMVLGVRCNRNIVFALMKYFKENKFGQEERKIRQRLARSFLYMGNLKKPDVEITELQTARYRISFDLPEENLLSLQKQAPAVSFVSKVALALCTAGFKHVYTVPRHELAEYQEFRKSKEVDKYLRVSKEGVSTLLEEATDLSYLLMEVKGSVILIVSLVGTLAGIWLSQLAVMAASLIFLVISQVLGAVPGVPESGYVFINTVLRKKMHRRRIREQFEKLLGD
nr:hypothetical protein [Candidatus Njordarchaeum guaymaensis]